VSETQLRAGSEGLNTWNSCQNFRWPKLRKTAIG